MSSIASITKKLGVGTISTLSSMAGIGKLIVGSLGDIQAVSASAGTLAGLVLFLNSLPMWFVVGSFALSTGYLIWSAIQDDLTRSRAITEAKDANDDAGTAGNMTTSMSDFQKGGASAPAAP